MTSLKPPPLTPLSSRVHCRSRVFYLLSQSSTGERGMGIAVSSSHIVSAASSSSQYSTAPVLGLSHKRQSSMKFSNMSPFHGVQSFRNRLLQRGSSTSSQVLSANQLQHDLLSMGHRLMVVSAPVTISMGCRWISALTWSSMGYRGTASLPVVYSMCCRGFSVPALGAPPPTPYSLTLVSA